MIARTMKEQEVYFGMCLELRRRGFRVEEVHDDYDCARHPDTGITVQLGRTASVHDPIYAAVSNLPPDNHKAWNAKGLAIHLDKAEGGLLT